MKFFRNSFRPALAMLPLLASAAILSAASPHEGRVLIGEVPVPGVVVTAVQGDKKLTAATNANGTYSFADLADGVWTIQIEMTGFAPVREQVTVSATGSTSTFALKMLPLTQVKTEPVNGFVASTAAPQLLQALSPADAAEDGEIPQELRQRAADGLLINGSVSNGASTPFALNPAFGNNRRGFRSPYNGLISVQGNNAALDARPFSLTGQNTPQPAYSRTQTNFTLGGPFQIPKLFRRGNFTVGYSRTQNRNASLQTAQMPTASERVGDFSQTVAPVIDPNSGTPFSGNIIPADRLSPQALALLGLYPLPNFSGTSRYNYQVPVVGVTHGDNFTGAINNVALNSNERLSGTFGYSSTRSDNPDLFGFTDVANARTTNASVTWNHRFTQRVNATIRYQFSRTVSESLPYFGTRLDISGIAGITGNDQDPRNWGPPSLNFSGGIARLSSGSFAFDRSQSSMISYGSSWTHLRHAISYGVDFRRQQFNLLSQRDARGSFTFTGATTGNDFADFLLGVPATSSIAFGNADKYFRQSFTNAFVTDDWRIRAALTLSIGVRWEYESPITELYGRLVNLDVGPGFSSATPVVAGSGSESLVKTDKSGIQPRVALAWRPRAASSLIVRAGYGLYREPSVYRALADQMAQQSPLSKSLSVQNSASNPFTLANGFQGVPGITATTFAIDPNYRVGTAQNWNLSIQQDLPQSMQMTITYLGIKGTHVPQRILPNTFPVGGVLSCVGCPTGFVYLMSGGNSNRHAGTIEVRRRQRNGFQASVQYTYAKAIDDAGLGGNNIAQNWLDRRNERALSNFDQRHQVTAQAQYTTGMLTSVGGFWDGWRGTLLKEWTITGQVTAGSGSPLTPIILAPTQGTGITGSLRPDLTASPIYLDAAGAFLNPAAFATPAPGTWGNASRNSITGPGQFGFNATVARTFRLNERVSMDVRVDSTNVLNHVTFPNWNTTVNSSQFGLPTRANAMRTLQPSVRVRF
jgi:hypothetical protein